VLSGGGSFWFRGRGSGERRAVTGDSIMMMMLIITIKLTKPDIRRLHARNDRRRKRSVTN
jgi:hypothetical protein